MCKTLPSCHMYMTAVAFFIPRGLSDQQGQEIEGSWFFATLMSHHLQIAVFFQWLPKSRNIMHILLRALIVGTCSYFGEDSAT
jgi:hypothetical protein